MQRNVPIVSYLPVTQFLGGDPCGQEYFDLLPTYFLFPDPRVGNLCSTWFPLPFFAPPLLSLLQFHVDLWVQTHGLGTSALLDFLFPFFCSSSSLSSPLLSLPLPVWILLLLLLSAKIESINVVSLSLSPPASSLPLPSKAFPHFFSRTRYVQWTPLIWRPDQTNLRKLRRFKFS